jgi:hypothetical protein
MTDKEKKDLVKFFISNSLPDILEQYKKDRKDRIKYVLIARSLRLRLIKNPKYKPVVEKLGKFIKTTGFFIKSSDSNNHDN